MELMKKFDNFSRNDCMDSVPANGIKFIAVNFFLSSFTLSLRIKSFRWKLYWICVGNCTQKQLDGFAANDEIKSQNNETLNESRGCVGVDGDRSTGKM